MSVKGILLAVVLLLTGALAGVMLDRHFELRPASGESVIEHAVKHLDPGYICPMHAEIVADQPGSCPICGMDLVEITPADNEANETDDEHPVVSVPSSVINSLGVRVAQVERTDLVRTIETPGFVQTVRKEKHTRYAAPAKGRISKLHFAPGQWMEKGDPLVDIEVDDLVRLQEKHLQLLAEEKNTTQQGGQQERESENDSDSAEPVETLTLAVTRSLMKRAGMTDREIGELEQGGQTSALITLYATHPGRVMDLKVSAGDEVKSNGFLFTLGGLMRVTVLANAFQRDAVWVQAGQQVDIILPNESREPIKGVVSQGAVSISATSQNIGVKLSFTAPLDLVKNGMYVIGHIYGRVSRNALSLPREAVIYTENEQRVIKALGDGRFKPVRIRTGITTSDRVEILEGLEEGDTVVVSAQFLIDSESSLQASYRRMKGVE